MTKAKVTRTKAKDPVPQKETTAPVSVPRPDYQTFGAAHCAAAAPYQHFQSEKLSDLSKGGSVELYIRLHPQSALQSILSTLIVNVSNATNECLHQAATISPNELQHRAINLRHAFKGAAVVTQLADALERVRRSRPDSVNVRNVNLESGGQAIVGMVQSNPREKELEAVSGSDHPKASEK